MRTQTEQNERTLEEVAPGERGVILQVGNENGPVKRRLVDMGLTPGTEVTVRKVAPFGDPVELNLRGYELSLRKADAAQIRVATGAEGERRAQTRRRRIGMVQHIPDEETLRRMDADHAHEAAEHGGVPDYASHDTREMKLALVGNPNCGKTTLFNALTGSNQYVGNWPGVTVEKKEGRAQVEGKSVTVVDLPGIYSLSPYSMEEIVARDFIVGERPDAIIDIIDATNIERNLYLTAQLLELERPMVIALNFMDEVEKHGDHIDVAGLSKALGVPVIPITARSGENIQTLLEAAHRQMHVGVTIEPDDLYDGFTHQIHHKVGELIHDKAYAAHIPAHWASIKLIEGDALVEKALGLSQRERDELEAVCREYEGAYDLGDRETLIADARYQFIQTVVAQCVRRGRPLGAPTLSDRIDAIVTHKVLAIPVFLLMMLCMFALTFGPGQMLADGVDALIGGWFAGGVRSLLAAAGTAPWVEALLVDGVIAGVGGVLTFLPQIAILFLFLSFLEDSGYMARAAFIMDRLLPLRPVRQGVYPHAHGLRLHRPGSHGSPHHGEREGPPHDHHAGSLYVLLRPAAGVRPAHRRLLPPIRRAGGIFPLSAGTALRHRLGHPPQEAGFPGRARRFRAGAAPLPPAHPQKYRPPRVGEGKGLPGEGGHPDSGHECAALVPPVFRL